LKSPGSILPQSPVGSSPAAPPVRDQQPPVELIDESPVQGAIRRLGEFAADMRDADQRTAWIIIALLSAMLVYSYWPGLLNAKSSWSNPQYSHGWLVPLCSVALLFWWRRRVEAVTPAARLAGLGLLAGSFLVRLACAHYSIVTIDMYTFVPAIVGVFLMAGGWPMLRWAWAPLAALIFMYPLPDEATRYLLGPLQTLATIVSSYALQTVGLDAYREGNQIILGDAHVLGVVDACSGLRMLTIFMWLSLMLVLVWNGEWWENLIIFASSIPIALIVNSTRITLTGVMYTINPVWAEKLFHDWAGYFMMPMALGLLFLEQALLSKLVVAEYTAPAVVLGNSGPTGPMQKRPETNPRSGGVFSVVPRPDSGREMG